MSGAQPDPDITALMRDPDTLGGPVEVIETHAALVFLSGERAYKLKKPVDLGFLDFSERAARCDALQAELDLNRPAAPQLYRRLIWISRGEDGRLTLDGRGDPVEPVLEMARFDQDQLLDHLAVSGEVDGPLARDLADAVFDSHGRAPPARVDNGTWRMRQVLADAARRCRRERGAPADRVQALAEALDERLCEHADLLDARARAGFVRRGHGDLHLKNIVRLDGRPVLFDALEFDEELATTDTLYDLAFLLMDLIHRGLGSAAAALLSQYAARLDGELAVEGLALLPAFGGVRALIFGFDALVILPDVAPSTLLVQPAQSE
jgi:aminoglycoside phosphotransferase family enzyme